MWRAIEQRLDERPAPRSFLRRFWPPLAAAALVLLALFLPRSATHGVRVLAGDAAQGPGGTWTCSRVSRIVVDAGVTITTDAGTRLSFPSPARLALKAGRVFLEVSPQERGYSVQAGGLTATTLGTAFQVEDSPSGPRVMVEKGHVRCAAGGKMGVAGPGDLARLDESGAVLIVHGGAESDLRSFFRRPTLVATLLDDTTLRITLRNDMPDPILLSPPTSGEPLFYASFSGHDYPLQREGKGARIPGKLPVRLAPGRSVVMEFTLPRAVPPKEPVLVRSKPLAVKVRAEDSR